MRLILFLLTVHLSFGQNCGTSDEKAADIEGFAVWYWNDTPIPAYTGSKGIAFSNGSLFIDSECYEQQIRNSGNWLKFHLNPRFPEAGSWCAPENNDNNMRAEFRTNPWNVNHPLGTEIWYGWQYRFGDDYKIDANGGLTIFQVYPGPAGLSPHLSFQIVDDNTLSGFDSVAGDLFVVNAGHAAGGSSNDYVPTSLRPKAGDVINFVVHAVWGDETNGETEVWMNGIKVYDKQAQNVLETNQWGGNAKWGWYHNAHRNSTNVQASVDAGTSTKTLYMGPLRRVMRRPGNPDLGVDAYNLVNPVQ